MNDNINSNINIDNSNKSDSKKNRSSADDVEKLTTTGTENSKAVRVNNKNNSTKSNNSNNNNNNNDDTKRNDDEDPFLVAAMSRKWKVSGKKKYLKEFYQHHIDHRTIENARLMPREDDPAGYMTVIDMLRDSWLKNEVMKEPHIGIPIFLDLLLARCDRGTRYTGTHEPIFVVIRPT